MTATVGQLTVVVITSQVQEVDFPPDYGAFYTNDTTFAQDGTGTFNPRGWRLSPPANNPVVLLQGTTQCVGAVFQTQPGRVNFNLRGDSAYSWLTFVKTNLNSANAGPNEVGPVFAGTNIPPQINTYTSSITWTVIAGSATCSAGVSEPPSHAKWRGGPMSVTQERSSA